MTDQSKQQKAEQAERGEQAARTEEPVRDIAPDAAEQGRGGDLNDVKGGKTASKAHDYLT